MSNNGKFETFDITPKPKNRSISAGSRSSGSSKKSSSSNSAIIRLRWPTLVRPNLTRVPTSARWVYFQIPSTFFILTVHFLARVFIASILLSLNANSLIKQNTTIESELIMNYNKYKKYKGALSEVAWWRGPYLLMLFPLIDKCPKLFIRQWNDSEYWANILRQFHGKSELIDTHDKHSIWKL